MSTQCANTNQATENEYPKFVDVNDPRRLDAATLAQLDAEQRGAHQAGHDRFYAVARTDGALVRDPADPLAVDDACRVLYADASCERTIECEFRVAAGEWDGIERSILVGPDWETVGTPSESVREWVAPVLACHGIEGDSA